MEKFKQLQNVFKGDRVIWIVFFILFLISVIEVYSASASLGYKSGNYWFAATYHFGLLAFGFFAMLVVLNIPCRYFKVLTPIMYPLSVILLVLVYVVGTKENDASRWLKIGFIPLQPSEVAKGTLILTTAHILSVLQTPQGAAPKAFMFVLLSSAVLIGLVFPENFSTAALMATVVLSMMFIGRVRFVTLMKFIGVVSVVVLLAIMAIMAFGQSKEQLASQEGTENTEKTETDSKKNSRGGLLHRADVWKERIISFNEPDVPPEKYDMDNKGQEGRARIAIASCNIIGKGPGNSIQRDKLPLAFSDFIYAIIIEEMGITGAFVVAMLYIILLFRTGQIAAKCENAFPAFLAMGLALMIAIQAVINMGVAVGIVPVTGQPLPLISKGGTSSIINCVYIGVILSVSRTAKKRPEEKVAVADI